MSLTAGVDSSTQSCKVLIVDSETGQIVRQGKAPHPNGTEVDPQHWWNALEEAVADAGGLDDVEAISIAGQQHGMVCLDDNGNIIRPALLWNDTRSAPQAEALIDERGEGSHSDGVAAWVDAVGSAPVASLTISKVRWLAENEPGNLARVAAICLPHDWLTWKLMNSTDIRQLVTDRSDASGTGYVDCEDARYRRDLLDMALRKRHPNPESIVLPRIAGPWECVGTSDVPWAKGLRIGPGCGDNAGAALGLGLGSGQASISLGTSGVVAAVSDNPVKDPKGIITGFMDATGKWLPLACTLNASRIIDAMKTLLGASYEQFDALALSAEKGAQGVSLLPYFEGERTPNLPDATAELTGLTLANCTAENVARASVEGLATLMKGALDALEAAGCHVDRALLLGGGARSRSVREILPDMMGIPVEAVESAEYVALGAARQAAQLKNAAASAARPTDCARM